MEEGQNIARLETSAFDTVLLVGVDSLGWSRRSPRGTVSRLSRDRIVTVKAQREDKRVECR